MIWGRSDHHDSYCTSCKVQSNEEAPCSKHGRRAGRGRGNRNEGMLTPQPAPVRGRLCQFVEGWKHIMNDPYLLSIVTKGVQTSFYEYTHSAQDPMGNKISPGAPEGPGNAGANIPDSSKERDHRDTSGYSRILLERIPDTQSVRRLTCSSRFKTTERPHLRTSLSHTHYKLSAEYCRKRRLCV